MISLIIWLVSLVMSFSIKDAELEEIRPDVEEDIQMGAFPEIEGLVSCRLNEGMSVQLDTVLGSVLVASNDCQWLLGASEAWELLCFLEQWRECLSEKSR